MERAVSEEILLKEDEEEEEDSKEEEDMKKKKKKKKKKDQDRCQHRDLRYTHSSRSFPPPFPLSCPYPPNT